MKEARTRTLDRREFTVETVLAMLSGVTITVSACGGSGPQGPTAEASPTPVPTPQPTPTPEPSPTPTPNPQGTPTPEPSPTPSPQPTPTPTPQPTPTPTPQPSPTPTPLTDKTGTISANHGHRAVITGAQLTAGNAVNLDIQGTAAHPHSVQLSASEVQAIADNQRVSKASSTDSGHNHTVTFN
jgi:outer membrane biosynthesis protein TonB